jgi:hypothetical protein
MMKRSVMPPYTPMLDEPMDLKHFDNDIVNIPIESPPLQNSGDHSNNNYLD